MTANQPFDPDRSLSQSVPAPQSLHVASVLESEYGPSIKVMCNADDVGDAARALTDAAIGLSRSQGWNDYLAYRYGRPADDCIEQDTGKSTSEGV